MADEPQETGPDRPANEPPRAGPNAAFSSDATSAQTLRVCTFNVNGLRAWSKYLADTQSSLATFLTAHRLDLLCLQETKLSGDDHLHLPIKTILPLDAYDSIFNTTGANGKQGYSGVCTYWHRDKLPLASYQLGLGPSTSAGTFIQRYATPACPLRYDLTSDELAAIDSEGRILVTEHAPSVLIVNAYLPVSHPDVAESRLAYRAVFNRALDQFFAWLLEACPTHTILFMGDLNASYDVRDHCDASHLCFGLDDAAIESWLRQVPSRQWLRQLVSDHGPFVDTYRLVCPDARLTYSCWRNLLAPRRGNDGSRIDYVLLDRRSLAERRAVVHENRLLTQVHGSDHCPVVAQVACAGVASTSTVISTPSSNAPTMRAHRQKHPSIQDFFVKRPRSDALEQDRQAQVPPSIKPPPKRKATIESFFASKSGEKRDP